MQQQQVNESDRKELTRIKRRIDDKEIFDTPKPEQLLYRIIQIATNEEDLLLDCFLGSGTTMAVAHKMKRNYIGIDIDEKAFKYDNERMEKVCSGEKGGISATVEWQGGNYISCKWK